jgi:hypothetical protein
MFRFRAVVALTVAVSLAFAAVASAGVRTPITGGTTSLTPSSSLTGLGITATPVAPATASGASFSFPISGGRLNPLTDRGVVRDTGALTLAGKGGTVMLRAPIVESRAHKLALYAERDVQRVGTCRPLTLTRRHRLHPRRRCVVVRTYRLIRVGVAAAPADSSGTVAGTLDATPAMARLLSRISATTVAAGTPLGTLTIAPTVSSAS